MRRTGVKTRFRVESWGLGFRVYEPEAVHNLPFDNYKLLLHSTPKVYGNYHWLYTKALDTGLSENQGTLFGGPYNKDPAI